MLYTDIKIVSGIALHLLVGWDGVGFYELSCHSQQGPFTFKGYCMVLRMLKGNIMQTYILKGGVRGTKSSNFTNKLFNLLFTMTLF